MTVYTVSMIIGIAGTIGSGKGTVVEYLKAKGFSHYSSSAILKDMIREQGLLETRENLSHLADELMTKFPGGILHFSHLYAEQNDDENYILEALHRVNEATYVRSIGGLILGIDADIQIRYERISKRNEGQKDKVTFEQFVIDADREDEGLTGSGPNIREVVKMADYTISNNGTLEELHVQIEEILEKIKSR